MTGWGSGVADLEPVPPGGGWGAEPVFPEDAHGAGWTGTKQPSIPVMPALAGLFAPTVIMGVTVVVPPRIVGEGLPRVLPFDLGRPEASMGASAAMVAPDATGLPVAIPVGARMNAAAELLPPVVSVLVPELAPYPMLADAAMPAPHVALDVTVPAPVMGGALGLPYRLPFTLDDPRTVASMLPPSLDAPVEVPAVPMTGTAALGVPVVVVSQAVTPPAMSAVAAVAAPQVVSGVLVQPTPMTTRAALQPPAATDGDTAAAPAMGATAALPVPVVQVLALVVIDVPTMGAPTDAGFPYELPFPLADPGDRGTRAEFATPAVGVGFTIPAPLLAATAATTAPDVTAGATITPASATATAAMSTPAAVSGVTAFPPNAAATAAVTPPAKVSHDPVLMTITSSQTVTLPGWFRVGVDKVDVIPYGGGSGTRGSGIGPGNGGAGSASSALGVTGNGGGSSSSTSLSNASATTFNGNTYNPGSTYARGGNPGTSGTGTVTPGSASFSVTVGDGGSAGSGGAFGSAGSSGVKGVVYLRIYQA